jgi:hypothetical protein
MTAFQVGLIAFTRVSELIEQKIEVALSGKRADPVPLVVRINKAEKDVATREPARWQ